MGLSSRPPESAQPSDGYGNSDGDETVMETVSGARALMLLARSSVRIRQSGANGSCVATSGLTGLF